MSPTLEPDSDAEYLSLIIEFVEEEYLGELPVAADVDAPPSSGTPQPAGPGAPPRGPVPASGSSANGSASPPRRLSPRPLFQAGSLNGARPSALSQLARPPLLPGPAPVSSAHESASPSLTLALPPPSSATPQRMTPDLLDLSKVADQPPGSDDLHPLLAPMPAIQPATVDLLALTPDTPLRAPAARGDVRAIIFPASVPAAVAAVLGAILSARVAAPAPTARASSPRQDVMPAPSRALMRQRQTVSSKRTSAARHRSSPVISALKLGVLAVELGAILVLATYAGVIPLLPGMPPAMRVTAVDGGSPVAARQSLYCWFTPGQGRCLDPTLPAAQSLPTLTVHAGTFVEFRFSFPAPTACTAMIPDPTSSLGDLKPLGSVLSPVGSDSFMERTSRLRITLAPGTYSLDVSCRWHPPQMLRWLRGQGESSYWIELRVLAGR